MLLKPSCDSAYQHYMWSWQLSSQVWTVRDMAPDVCTGEGSSHPPGTCAVKLDQALFYHVDPHLTTGVGKHNAAHWSEIRWASKQLWMKKHLSFPTSFPQSLFAFLVKHSPPSLTLGCSGVVLLYVFSSLLSPPCLSNYISYYEASKRGQQILSLSRIQLS